MNFRYRPVLIVHDLYFSQKTTDLKIRYESKGKTNDRQEKNMHFFLLSEDR
jgi:hypothetical protein